MIPRRTRGGMTLMEIMVVLSIMVGVLLIAVPSVYSIFDLQQRGAARDLGLTYKFLVQEATMRNVSFRISYNLDDNSYLVEVGDPNTLVFSSPEAREKFEQDQDQHLRMFNKEDRAKEQAATEPRYSGLTMPGFDGKVELPTNSAWGFVYTPQYPEPQTWHEKKEDDPPQIVYSYVFANGDCEYTAVRIVNKDDPEDGYSVEVEPVSGEVRVSSELIEVGQSLSWLPTEAPTIQ